MGIENMKYVKLLLIIGFLTFTVSCGQQKGYIQYRVKTGETMISIAEKLKMSPKDLLRLNPDFNENLKPNSFIVVPENKYDLFKNQQIKNGVVIEEIESTPEKNILIDKAKVTAKLFENFEVYEVVKGDTFYSLERRFGVSIDELLLLNPELKEGLKEGSILKIKEFQNEKELQKEIVVRNSSYNDYIKLNKSLKVSLLLPFRGDIYNYDSISPRDIFQKNTLANIATDLYLGAEFAVDSLRKRGIDIEFSIYDTGARKSNGISKIIYEQNLNNNDLIIGPLYSEEAQLLASRVNVPIIFPLYSSNQSEFNNPNIITASPDKKIFKNELIRYIKNNFSRGNLIIVSDQSEVSNSIKNALNTAILQSSITILTPENGVIEKSRFLQILRPNTNNWIVFAANNEVTVSDAINSLISLPSEIKTNVFAFDKGSVYDKIDNIKLAKIGFTYVSEEFVDGTSDSSKIFNKAYLSKNNAIPTLYATKGFDITYDILIRLASGKKLSTTFKEGASIRVVNKFDFINKGSFQNEGLFILQMNEDLTLSKLK